MIEYRERRKLGRKEGTKQASKFSRKEDKKATKQSERKEIWEDGVQERERELNGGEGGQTDRQHGRCRFNYLTPELFLMH